MFEYRPQGALSTARAMRAVGADPAQPTCAEESNWLVDLRQAELQGNSQGDLSRLGAWIAQTAIRAGVDECRICVITDHALTVGLANVVRAYATAQPSPVAMRLVADEPAARAWLEGPGTGR